MANIVKINEVYLLTGFVVDDVVECAACKRLLDANNIKYVHLHYGDEGVHQQNFDALSTWTFGADFRQVKFTKFPIVYWKEFYDDYERFVEVVTTSADLATSNLIKNKALVV